MPTCPHTHVPWTAAAADGGLEILDLRGSPLAPDDLRDLVATGAVGGATRELALTVLLDARVDARVGRQRASDAFVTAAQAFEAGRPHTRAPRLWLPWSRFAKLERSVEQEQDHAWSRSVEQEQDAKRGRRGGLRLEFTMLLLFPADSDEMELRRAEFIPTDVRYPHAEAGHGTEYSFVIGGKFPGGWQENSQVEWHELADARLFDRCHLLRGVGAEEGSPLRPATTDSAAPPLAAARLGLPDGGPTADERALRWERPFFPEDSRGLATARHFRDPNNPFRA